MADIGGTAELIGTAVAAAIAVLGGHHGVSWVKERRNGKNGKEKRSVDDCLRMHTSLETQMTSIHNKLGEVAEGVAYIRGKIE